MIEESSFEVILLVHLRDDALRRRIESAVDMLARETPLFESADAAGFHVPETVRFRCEWAESAPDLFARLERILASPGSESVIGISDEFAIPSLNREWEPTDLAKAVRQLFVQASSIRAGRLCGLVALVDNQPQRTKDVDRTVGVAGEFLPNLKSAINKAADGLWLKSARSRPAPLGEEDAVKVFPVRSEAELEDCLRLRQRVYDALGYLPHNVSAAPLEADHFDPTSLHFVAIDERLGEVIGAMRLALQELPQYLPNSILGQPRRMLARQRRWLHNLVRTKPVLHELVGRTQALPLPILENSDFGERWPEFLDHNQTKYGGEISRVVVAPRYQGLGVSRLLLLMGIAVAYDLRKQFLLLECIPSHVEMYRKYDFEPLPGHHCRAQGLDQIAVGMRLELDDSPLNAAVGLAKRQLEFLRRGNGEASSLSTLCLCSNSRCWRDGGYSAQGTRLCPLREFHAARIATKV